MIQHLGANANSVKAYTEAIGKTITALQLDKENDVLRLTFSDDSKIRISDEGQSCCERRYMVTADKLEDFIGAKFLGAEIKDADGPNDNCLAHDLQFLDIKTDKGVFQIANHNEHNGYYGGFAIRVVVA